VTEEVRLMRGDPDFPSYGRRSPPGNCYGMESDGTEDCIVEEGTLSGRLPGKPEEIEKRPLDPSPKLAPQIECQEVPPGPVGITVSELLEED
jgi:hypothetical protein